MTAPENIAAEDVKHKLFQSLKTRGVLDSLKSQLRKQLIWELQDTTGLPVLQSSVNNSVNKKDDGTPLYQRIANSLVVEHLKRCNYEYTLSTFLPESGISSDKVFTIKDILHLLHIDPESRLHRNLERTLSSPKDSRGFLWQFMIEMTALHSKSRCDVEIQTDEMLPTRTGSLEDKLSNVEKEFSEKLRLCQLDKDQGMEEKLIAVQRKYEMQKRKELEEEIKKFKANEMSRLRLEAREKYETEVKKIRQEYDQEFNVKHQALRAMEKEMLERMQRLQEVHESETYAERQKILQEMNSFKEREADLRNRILLQERSQKVEEERLNTEAGRLQSMEDALKEKEKFREQKYQAEVERFKTDYEQQFMTRQQELLHRESRLAADRLKLDAERKEYLMCHDNLNACKENNVQLQASVETSRLLLENINKEKAAIQEKLDGMKNYEILKENEIKLKKDIEHLTQRLAETNAHWAEKGKRQQSLLKELTDKAGKPPKETVAMRKENKGLKEKLKSQEKSSSETRKNLENLLDLEIQRANHFQKLYEDQLGSQSLMETEIENLKMMVQQAEQLPRFQEQKVHGRPITSPSRRRGNFEQHRTGQAGGREVSAPRSDTDDTCSSAVDESSLISLTEDKKIFQRLEKEAEALDASYRDFQNRMRNTRSHTIASMPSSMSFRRLPSYHSFHSPEIVPNSANTWINSTVPSSKDTFHPLTMYDGYGLSEQMHQFEVLTKRHSKLAGPGQSNKRNHASKRTESAPLQPKENAPLQPKIPVADSVEVPSGDFEVGKLAMVMEENAVLTVKDLDIATDTVTLPPTRFARNTGCLEVVTKASQSDTGIFQVDDGKSSTSGPAATSERTSVGKHSRRSSEQRHRRTDDPIVKAATVTAGRGMTPGHRTVGEMSTAVSADSEPRSTSEKSVDRKSTNSLNNSAGHDSATHTSITQLPGKLPDHEETTLDSMWERREHSLDMEELERRRQEDAERFDKAEDLNDSERVSEKSSHVVEYERGSAVRSDSEELPLSQEDGEHKNNDEEEIDEEIGRESAIDPVMLKYMEMIKQRREDEAKNRSEDSHVSMENGDDDVSVGKLSDEDFDWG